MKKEMKIVFEGQNSQIDANTLINVLIHYQTVVAEANKELGGGTKDIELKVNAIEKGSFIIDVSVVESVIRQIFSGSAMGYLASLCTVVGGVFGAYRLLKGRPAKTEEDKSSITVKGVGNRVEINQTIVNVYNNRVVREAVSKAIETADADASVEGLKVDTGEGDAVEFGKADFKEYIYTGFDEEEVLPEEVVETVDAVLTIIALNFEPGSRWQFMYNGFK